nr:aldolase/citrate lyase family protein [Kiritimatiellia bacterium]
MNKTKQKLKNNETALGGWMLIPHPAIAELMAGEGFDWIALDMEHAAVDLSVVEQIERAVRPSGCDLLVRLDGVNPVLAKHVLDAGAKGVIVPSVM